MDRAPVSNGDSAETQVGNAWTSAAEVPVTSPTALRGDERLVDLLHPSGGGSTAAGTQAVSVEGSGSDIAQVDAADVPEVLEHVYQPLLQHLESECRRVLAAAATEAEKVRSQAQDEARRILTEAHRERSALFRRASSKQALMYQEAEAEIERWLEELDEERQVVMGTAQEDAARLLRTTAEQAEVDAHARLEAADREAQSIVSEARLEAAKYGSSSVIQPDAGARPSISASTPVTTDSWLARVQGVIPETEEPATQWSPGLTSVSAAPAPSDAVAEDRESTPQVEPPKAEIPDVEIPDVEILPAPAVPLADSELALDEAPPSVGTTDESEDETSAALFGVLGSSTTTPDLAPPASDDAAQASDAEPTPDDAASGANGTVVDGTAPNGSLSRRERRNRRRFGLGKSGR